MQGPNVKRLIVHKMSLMMVPGGAKDPLPEILASLSTRGNIEQCAKEATAWVEDAIAAVKAAPDNTFGDDSEAIAGHILREVWRRMGPSTCDKCGGTRIHTRTAGYICTRCR